MKSNQAVNKAVRSKVEIETEFLQFSNPKSKTIVIEIESNENKEIKDHSMPKAIKIPKKNSSRKKLPYDLNSILFIHFLPMIFKP